MRWLQAAQREAACQTDDTTALVDELRRESKALRNEVLALTEELQRRLSEAQEVEDAAQLLVREARDEAAARVDEIGEAAESAIRAATYARSFAPTDPLPLIIDINRHINDTLSSKSIAPSLSLISMDT